MDCIKVFVECVQVSLSDTVATFEEFGHGPFIFPPVTAIVTWVDLHAQHEGNVGKHTMDGCIDLDINVIFK